MTDPKPCGCPDTLQTPMTVAELRALLAEYSGDTPIWVRRPDYGLYRRPNPVRLRTMPEPLGWRGWPGYTWREWSEEYDGDDPRAVEGICL